jgi:hypothetical protein
MKNVINSALLIVTLLLGGCATMPSADSSAGTRKPFILEEALAGHTTGHAVITPVIGAATMFDVSINGTWDGQVLTLVEDFKYPSGTTERKTWRLTKTPAGDYVGTREDVIGQARAYRDGTTLRLDYRVALDTPLGKTAHFQDVLYWENAQTIRNKATVSKYGLRLARVNLQITRSD